MKKFNNLEHLINVDYFSLSRKPFLVDLYKYELFRLVFKMEANGRWIDFEELSEGVARRAQGLVSPRPFDPRKRNE